MHNENNLPGSAENGAPSSSLAEFQRLAEGNSGRVERWVECTVVHRTLVAGQDELNLVDQGAAEGEPELLATLPGPVLWRLQSRHGAQPEWISALVGSRVTLLLRARPGEKPMICDISPKWVDDLIRAEYRACRRELADLGAFESQHQLADPSNVGRICVLADDHDPTWPSIEQRLAELGTTYSLELATFDGNSGRLSVIGALRRASARAEDGEIDLVVMVYDGPLREGAYVLHNDDAATTICTMRVPVVVGLRRPPQGSLVHDASFMAAETPEHAIDIVEGLIWRAKEATSKEHLTEQSEQRWRDERASRE